MPRSGATFINQADGSGVGDVRSSMLSLAQFQSQNGTNWVLADGTSAAGTRYNAVTGNANLPDLRGVGLRGKNNGRADGNQDPDGERALGSFQDHSNSSHDHGGATGTHNHGGATGSHSHDHSTAEFVSNSNLPAGGSTNRLWNSNQGGQTARTNTSTSVTASIPSGTASISAAGGNESRMRNVAINHFIKVN